MFVVMNVQLRPVFVATNNSMLVDKLGPNLKTANNLAPLNSPILAPLVPL